MKKKTLLFRTLALVAALACALGIQAAEAYACFTSSNGTLTFYYDNQRSSRPGTTYDLNTGDNYPNWGNAAVLNNTTRVVFDPSFANARPTSTNSWFENMYNLLSITGIEYLNTSQVTDMRSMFFGCNKLTSLDVSHFNTAKVTDMGDMFDYCSNLPSLDVSGFNTAKVKYMEDMFSHCNSLTNLDLSSFNTSNVIDMTHMFRDCSALTSVDLSSFNTSQVTDMSFMFQGCNALTSVDLSSFNTSNVTSMCCLFEDCTSLTSVDLSSFNTSNVTDMGNMFYNCTSLTSLDLSSFNTSKVTDMSGMFYNCSHLRTIYAGNGWSTAAVTNSNYMFYDCASLVGGQGTTYRSSNPTDKTYAHIDGGTSNPGYFTEFKEAYACYTPSNATLTFYYDSQRSSRTGTTYNMNTGENYPGWYSDGTRASVTKVVFDPSFADARPTTTNCWFYLMGVLQSITGMEYLNTSEVTDMQDMFCCCEQLTSLDLSSFNTSQVTNTSYMFYGCSGLTSLDLSSFNTSQVTNMMLMFSDCSNLQTIYGGNGWNTAAVTRSSYMFNNCTSLVGGQGTTWNSSNPMDKTYAHIDGGPSNPGYFTEFKEAYACYTPSNTTLTFYCDDQRSSRPGTTYYLNTGSNETGWYTDGTNASVTKVVFDPSFADARPTTTYDWFCNMANLQTITGMSYLNTSEVTNMTWMFGYCSSLTNLDLSHFNTSQVTSMSTMFYNCSGLTSLDLSSFNTSQVTNMGYMFQNCYNLQTIYVGNGWSTAAVTNSTNMFNYCFSLVGGQGTTYNANYIDKTYARIDGGPSNPGYFTAEGNEPWTNKETYACYTPENTTLTFYYDNQRSSRPGTTYNLNTGANYPYWMDGTNSSVTKVVFDPSFAAARPTTTFEWFYNMKNLLSIEGIEYLNTSEVTNMAGMFGFCSSLTDLDLSYFNTSQVTDMVTMFYNSSSLRTIYVGNGWSTAAVTSSDYMFYYCINLVGGQGTAYNSSHIDAAYAHIDGGPSNPGYFSSHVTYLRGDVDSDGNVNIDDVTALIDYLLGTNTGINLQGADCDQSGNISIDDVTVLIDYLLSGHW